MDDTDNDINDVYVIVIGPDDNKAVADVGSITVNILGTSKEPETMDVDLDLDADGGVTTLPDAVNALFGRVVVFVVVETKRGLAPGFIFLIILFVLLVLLAPLCWCCVMPYMSRQREVVAPTTVEAELAKIRAQAAIDAARIQAEADKQAADQEAAMLSLEKQLEEQRLLAADSQAKLEKEKAASIQRLESEQAELIETSRQFAAYMEDNDIEFDPGSWNIDDRTANRSILSGIAKIMQEHHHVVLKIHGEQKGKTKKKGLKMYGEAYPDEPVPECGAITAQGRVLACMAVLVEMGIPSGRMVATAAIGNHREVQFLACATIHEATTTTDMDTGRSSISMV